VNRIVRGVCCALSLLTAPAAGAANFVELAILRVDDFLFPSNRFMVAMSVALDDDSGVSAITLSTPQQSFPLEQQGTSWEEEAAFGSREAMQTALDGTWTIAIIGGAAASTSTFGLDAASFAEGDFFATATVLNPADGATGVSSTVSFQWTDPTGPQTPDFLEVLAGGPSTEQFDDSATGTLSLTDTSWQPPLPLEAGQNEVDVIYLRIDPTRVTSTLQVTAGSIVWGASPSAPPGYPADTPLVAHGSDRIIGFTVPEPAAAALHGAALAALALVGRRRLGVPSGARAKRSEPLRCVSPRRSAAGDSPAGLRQSIQRSPPHSRRQQRTAPDGSALRRR
jgi:hypothetical protein